MSADIVVIGAGTVGAAIAYGLAGLGMRVVVLDGGDRDLRAASANFGLVWLQGKGLLRNQDRIGNTVQALDEKPAYQQLTRESISLWPKFCAELEDAAGIGLQYEQNGGLSLCMSAAEFEKRRTELLRWHNQLGGSLPDWEMVDRAALSKLLPKVRLGPDVVGASYGHLDGQVNPLRLLAALHAGILRKGGQIQGATTVRSIRGDGRGGFTIETGSEKVSAGLVVIAAGLGSRPLAAQVGLDVPIRPQRGQILVTERLEPFLPLPLHGLRQTNEGTIMIGTTHEETGFDNSSTTEAAASLSAKAIRQIPSLSDAKLVRQWAGLRIMTPDGHPIYAESQTHPGAFVAMCHSGITLAATHTRLVAEAIAAGGFPSSFDVFHHRRFDVPKAA